MIKLVSALALTALMLSPAAAASSRKSYQANQASQAYAQSAPSAPYADNGAFTPYAAGDVVVQNGKYIGRDPDPNIRLNLLRDAGSENQ